MDPFSPALSTAQSFLALCHQLPQQPSLPLLKSHSLIIPLFYGTDFKLLISFAVSYVLHLSFSMSGAGWEVEELEVQEYPGGRNSTLKLVSRECNCNTDFLPTFTLIILMFDIPVGPFLNAEMVFLSFIQDLTQGPAQSPPIMKSES